MEVTVMAQPHLQPMYPWPAPTDKFTADDLLDLPGDGHRYEIIDGGLHVAPPADISHHEIADSVMILLRTTAPPGWRAVREIGIRIGDSLVIPDVMVLAPGADRSLMWADPGQVALVVEVESRGSRRHDRFTKPSLYAEAGIGSYWRIERTPAGPVAHLYRRTSGGSYQLDHSVDPSGSHLVEAPYPVRVTPAAWTAAG
jgi:Uma2 family endonuclease